MMSKRPSGLRPGETVPVSGLYQQIGPRGGKGTEVTSVKGEPLPPAPVKGTTYKLVDPAKHKSGNYRRARGGPTATRPPNFITDVGR
jgi:hypothetical protein